MKAMIDTEEEFKKAKDICVDLLDFKIAVIKVSVLTEPKELDKEEVLVWIERFKDNIKGSRIKDFF